MSADLTLEISRVRHTLRLAAQSGCCTPEACEALVQLQELSRLDHGLYFEYCRWTVHLASLRSI